jgi:2-dehydro-3-deoxygalactonokinase
MQPFCAAVDWGTSSFRAWLIDARGNVLAGRRSDEGMRSLSPEEFAPTLERHLAALGASATLPAVICGMAGSRQGWVEARYCETPTLLGGLSQFCVRAPGLLREVCIIPGLAQRDPQRPDVMRGEETQLLGALGHLQGEAVACLPGTHSKWVRVVEGKVVAFSTHMTGELFDVISHHTILASRTNNRPAGSDDAFLRSVGQMLGHDARLTERLFSVRAGELLGFQEAGTAEDSVSGLLIGAEIAAARDGGWTGKPVRLIVSGELGALYQRALTLAAIAHEVVDAESCVIAGLSHVAADLFGAHSSRRSA